MNDPITERDLRDAYKRSGLWRIGMSYERAIAVPPIRTSLTCSVRAQRHRMRSEGLHQGKAGPRSAGADLSFKRSPS